MRTPKSEECQVKEFSGSHDVVFGFGRHRGRKYLGQVLWIARATVSSFVRGGRPVITRLASSPYSIGWVSKWAVYRGNTANTRWVSILSRGEEVCKEAVQRWVSLKG